MQCTYTIKQRFVKCLQIRIITLLILDDGVDVVNDWRIKSAQQMNFITYKYTFLMKSGVAYVFNTFTT